MMNMVKKVVERIDLNGEEEGRGKREELALYQMTS